MTWKTAEDFVLNSSSGHLPVWFLRPLTLREAKVIGYHEALHRQMAGQDASWWPCHLEGTPDDAWVVDMMVDGQFVRLGS